MPFKPPFFSREAEAGPSPSLRFDGIYQSEPDSGGSRTFIRFFPDGTVESATMVSGTTAVLAFHALSDSGDRAWRAAYRPAYSLKGASLSFRIKEALENSRVEYAYDGTLLDSGHLELYFTHTFRGRNPTPQRYAFVPMRERKWPEGTLYIPELGGVSVSEHVGRIGPPSRKPSLLESKKVIEDSAVVSALIELSGSKKVETRETCAASLGFAHVDEARAAEALGPLLQDPEKRIRVLAATSLGLLATRTPAAVPLLLQHVFASEEGDVVRAVLEPLGLGGCVDPEVAAHLAALAQGKRRGRSLFGRSVLRDLPSSWSILWPQVPACEALGTFPAAVSVPLLAQVIRGYTKSREWEMRRRIAERIVTRVPGGGEAADAILDALLREGGRQEDDEYPDMPASSVADSAEIEARGLLRALLRGPTPPEPLVRALARARRPRLAGFVPRLRELLGSTRLPVDLLATVKRGLSSPDELVRANCATLLMCLPAPGASEALVAARLEDEDPFVRASSAGFLGALGTVSPASLAALTRLAQAQPEGVDGLHAREALARLGAPVPLPSGGVDARGAVRRLMPVDFRVEPVALAGGDGALYVPWSRVVTPASEEGWSTDEDALGLVRVRLSDKGPRVESFPVLAPFPRVPAGDRDKRWLRLSLRLGEDIICVLRSPFREESRSWGMRNFVLLFSTATCTWSQLVPGGDESLRRVPIDAGLEQTSRAVGGLELLAWVDERAGQGPPEAASRMQVLPVKDSGLDTQEPWVVSAPGDAPLRLFNVRLAFLAHHPKLRAEDMRALFCQAAYRLEDASGRAQLVFFVSALLHSEDRAGAVLVLDPPAA